MYGESNGPYTVDLERPWKVKLKVTKIGRLISHKRAYLGPMLLLNINRKLYKSNGTLTFDLEWPWKVKVKVAHILG